MDQLSLKLCDIQERLFELSTKQGYDSEAFVSFFMGSDVAKDLDSEYNRMQWAGEEYLLEELTSDSSCKIYKQANFRTMKRNYMMFHTMDPELAIDDLIEIKKQ